MSENMVAKYDETKLAPTAGQDWRSVGCKHSYKDNIPIAISTTSAGGLTVSQRGTRARTHRGKVHHRRKCDDPTVHGINDVATIELNERPALLTWTLR